MSELTTYASLELNDKRVSSELCLIFIQAECQVNLKRAFFLGFDPVPCPVKVKQTFNFLYSSHEPIKFTNPTRHRRE